MNNSDNIIVVQFSKMEMDHLIKNNITKGTFSSIKKNPFFVKEEFGEVTQNFGLSDYELKKFCRDVRVFKKKTGLDIKVISILRKQKSA